MGKELFRSVQCLVMLLPMVGTLARPPLNRRAQVEDPYNLINAVNELRTLYGLKPYTVDPWLMGYAQEHSDYQAAIQMGTHDHSDGTRPWSIGLQENVAGGTVGVVNASVIVYQIWADWGHRHILIGYQSGEIGAGAALSENGFAYYTVDIRPGPEIEDVGTSAPPLPALQTSTPAADGSVRHVVGYGQALWSIAVSYGVTIAEIRTLNGLPVDSVAIYPGQELLIRGAGAPSGPPAETAATPAATATATKAPAAATPTGTEPAPATPSSTAAPLATPSSSDGTSTKDLVLWGLGIGIVGLSIAAGVGFWQAHREKEDERRA